jgi:hypothetical protein
VSGWFTIPANSLHIEVFNKICEINEKDYFLNIKNKKMIKQSTTSENLFKIIPVALGVFGFLYGVYQYVTQHNREYRQKIYESQLDLYKDVLDVCAKIANTPHDSITSDVLRQQSEKFDTYYYGKMILFENREVEKEMVRFKGVKDRYLRGDSSISSAFIKDNCLSLGYACRNSLQQTWGLELEVLQRGKK